MQRGEDQSLEPVSIDYERVPARRRFKPSWGWTPLLTIAGPIYAMQIGSYVALLLGGCFLFLGFIAAMIGIYYRRQRTDMALWGFSALVTAVATALIAIGFLTHPMP